MPTAARLIAAICLGLAGWGVSGVVLYRLTGLEADLNYLPHTMAWVGFIVGWLSLGPRVGGGFFSAVSLGLKAAATTWVFSLLLFGLNQVTDGMGYHAYKSPIDAGHALVGHFIRFAEMSFDWPIIAAMAIGGILSAVLADFADHVWN